MRFRNKIALVTGATAGIGETTARALHAEGCIVAIAGRDAAAANAVAEELDPRGQTARAFVADIADPDAVESMVHDVVAQFGVLHLAVNNAGITGPAGLNVPDYPVDDWRAVIETDLSGMFYCLKHEIPAMQASGGGAIVNLSSANGVVGVPGLSAYTAAKHGVLGLTRAAALEFASSGIRVNAVGPGYVETPRMLQTPDDMLDLFRMAHPLARMATPEEVSSLILFLLSSDAGFATGGFYPLDGGYTAQ